ncbi:MAG: hypothetical protein AVDCRST_MAG30-4287, partial [uncultured Solirubrobacteraceae bacterium]
AARRAGAGRELEHGGAGGPGQAPHPPRAPGAHDHAADLGPVEAAEALPDPVGRHRLDGADLEARVRRRHERPLGGGLAPFLEGGRVVHQHRHAGGGRAHRHRVGRALDERERGSVAQEV